MNRLLIILFFINVLVINSNAQSDFQNRHVYGLVSKFYYLDILPNEHYSLKVGMYLDRFVKGDYSINGDTLELVNFEFIKTEFELSKSERFFVEKGFSKFLIHDSLLIPVLFQDFLPCQWCSMQEDSTIIKEYAQEDGHVNYHFMFRSDSTFNYSTGSDLDHYSTNGTWIQNDDKISLNPDNSKNLLYWICTDNKLTMFENYLIGKTFNENDNIAEYQYLIGLKPVDIKN